MSKKVFIIFLISWTALFVSSLMYNIYSIRSGNFSMAQETLKAFFQEIVNARTWNASHQGVYVPVSDRAQPNPYLEDSLRDITTDFGLRLTKINPAYMTRLISEISEHKDLITYHITSLNPIRPANKANDWESIALKAFEEDKKEYFRISDNGLYYQYMAPLIVKKSCLSCHAKQGYKVGDVRGGISVQIRNAKYIHRISSETYAISFFHFIFWAIGIFGIVKFRNRSNAQFKIITQKNSELNNEIISRQNAEKEVKSINQNLEEKINKRTLQLEQAKNQLTINLNNEKEANAIKSRFINTISHEYRTPLTVILNSAEIIKLKIPGENKEELVNHIDNIKKSVELLNSLINDVVNFKIVDSKINKDNFITLDLIQLLKNVAEEMAFIDNNSHKINLSSDNESNFLKSDHNYLKLIFSNLIMNAFKYSDTDSPVDISIKTSSENIIVEIKDYGIGISESDLEHIFEPFFKSEKHIGISTGSGLGLSIIRKLVEGLGGVITCESEISKGAAFTVTLPLNGN